MYKEFREVVTVAEAEKRIQSALEIRQKPGEVTLGEALGRVLAEDIIAPINVPPFDRSAMDGYAVKARDTYGAGENNPKTLKLKGGISMGALSDVEITRGVCAAIPTGAPIPKGVDAVVMVEYTEKSKGKVEVYRSVASGENIMRAGADMTKGEKVLVKGHLLTPRDTGVLAALGIVHMKVFAKPKVAIISTGTEIAEPGVPLKPGMIYDVNSRTIADAVRENGGNPQFLGNARTEKELTRLIGKSDHDVILTSGGTSVGEEDLSYRTVEKLGKLLFHGMALKPGKPTMMGVVRGKPVIGLPGYPTSALVVFYLLVVPLLRKMAALPPLEPATRGAKLASRVYSAKGRLEYVPVGLKDGVARPISKGSGAITTLAGAVGYLVVKDNVEIVEEGSEVKVVMFR